MKVQAIRARARKTRFDVPIPQALAAATGVEDGGSVQWEWLDSAELHLLRPAPPQSTARCRAKR